MKQESIGDRFTYKHTHIYTISYASYVTHTHTNKMNFLLLLLLLDIIMQLDYKKQKINKMMIMIMMNY